MISAIKIQFKKLSNDVWSDNEYEILLMATDYTEYNETTGTTECVYSSLDSIAPEMKRAEETLIKARGLLNFIKENNPDRLSIVYILQENSFRYSNASLNCLEIYL